MIRTAVGRNNNGGSNPESSESDNSDKSECSYRGQSIIMYLLYSVKFKIYNGGSNPMNQTVQKSHSHSMQIYPLDAVFPFGQEKEFL